MCQLRQICQHGAKEPTEPRDLARQEFSLLRPTVSNKKVRILATRKSEYLRIPEN